MSAFSGGTSVVLVCGGDVVVEHGRRVLGPHTKARVEEAVKITDDNTVLVFFAGLLQRYDKPTMEKILAMMMAEYAESCGDVRCFVVHPNQGWGPQNSVEELEAFFNALKGSGVAAVTIVSGRYHIPRLRRIVKLLRRQGVCQVAVVFCTAKNDQATPEILWLEFLKHIGLTCPQVIRPFLARTYGAVFGHRSI